MTMNKRLLCGIIVGLIAGSVSGQDIDEFKIKRESVFEFAQKPKVARQGDKISIAFETKGFCDVSVAIEKATDTKTSGHGGKIIRHLVSGVLGPNAPKGFQKNSKKQIVIWDGKDDQGTYVDDKDSLLVRVSLGLKPQFERTLFWSPKKRIAPGHKPLFAAAPEGVYVHEGGGVDHIRLFDHKGNYVRTVYPFPPYYTSPKLNSNSQDALKAALSKVLGLKWIEYPQDSRSFPQWQGIMYSTMLTSGNNAGTKTRRINPTKYGTAASVMAWKPGYLALAQSSLNRLATDGTTGGLNLQGPKTLLPGRPDKRGKPTFIGPRSSVFSSDGKWLYLVIGHCVARLEYASGKKAEPFIGEPLKIGKDNAHFINPMSISMDAKGRLYVADYNNDRIQVFNSDGKLYKSIPHNKPLRVFVSPKNGHIYVGSWLVITPQHRTNIKLSATFSHLGPVDDPKQMASYPLPFTRYNNQISMNRSCHTHDIFVDFHTEPPTIWVVPGSGDSSSKLMQQRRDFSKGQWFFSRWSENHLRLYVEKGKKMVEKVNFAKDVAKAIGRIDPPGTPAHGRQRLYVNPQDERLYVMEGDGGVGKSTKSLLRIDPDSGKTKQIRLPFSTEEIAFDLNGLIYLRTDTAVGRYQLAGMREVPWDYGERIVRPGFDGDGGKVMAFIRLPTTGKPGQFHLGGFGVSPNGRIVVSCYNKARKRTKLQAGPNIPQAAGRAYTPTMYPGRARYAEVHVWDKHGKLRYEDALPGLTLTDGLAMDRDDNIYVLAAARRMINGKDPLPTCSGTLMKFKPKKGKVLSSSKKNAVPLAREAAPKRPTDVRMAFGGHSWVEGAEWLYGGVGRDGFLPNWAPNCSCWNSRPALDLYARSYATELGRSNVAILDTNGNLIMRIGKYGNVDDGMPIIKDGGPTKPRSIGGDEIALAAPGYVASHTDRRLFIADYGNFRILSVRLGYHQDERIPLKGIPDQEK